MKHLRFSPGGSIELRQLRRESFAGSRDHRSQMGCDKGIFIQPQATQFPSVHPLMKRTGDIVCFSPNYELSRLITAEPIEIADQLERRVEGFYLGPADLLNRKSHSFAAGVLCFVAIDAIARYEVARGYSSDRFKKWI